MPGKRYFFSVIHHHDTLNTLKLHLWWGINILRQASTGGKPLSQKGDCSQCNADGERAQRHGEAAQDQLPVPAPVPASPVPPLQVAAHAHCVHGGALPLREGLGHASVAAQLQRGVDALLLLEEVLHVAQD